MTSGVDLFLLGLVGSWGKNRHEWKLNCLENQSPLLILNNEVKVKMLLFMTTCRQMSYDPCYEFWKAWYIKVKVRRLCLWKSVNCFLSALLLL